MQVLTNELLAHNDLMPLIKVDHIGEVRPSPGGDKAFAVYRRLDFVEVRLLDVQISQYRRMDALLPGVLLPNLIVRFHIDPLESVPGHDIEFPDRVVVLRGIARRDYHPPRRDPVPAEYLVL